MNSVSQSEQHVSPKDAGSKFRRVTLLALLTAAGLASVAFPPGGPLAQRGREQGAQVREVSTSRQGEETTVSISGEGAMNRVQTWQDRDGFHVVFPGAKGGPGRLPKGVRAQRVADSLELVVPTREGANVTVQPRAGRLDLVVSGGLEEGTATPGASESARERASRSASSPRVTEEAEARRNAESSARREESAAQRREEQGASERGQAAGQSSASGAQTPAAATQQQQEGAQTQSESAAAESSDTSQPVGVKDAAAQVQGATSEEGASGGFSMMTLMAMLAAVALGGAAFVFVRRRKASGGESFEQTERPKKVSEAVKPAAVAVVKAAKPEPEVPPFEPYRGDRRKKSMPVAQDRRRMKPEDMGTSFSVRDGGLALEGRPEKSDARPTEARHASFNPPPVVFGAYRIDQEVTKLVEGQPHSIEVLASRASDDRRAIETSLVKALTSKATTESGLWRVRQALEDYGFVARQSASLLLSTESYERVSAARVLGQIRSSSSLTFLLEALYDAEPVVRAEVVTSLGALGLPKAIGALIDVARRYPDIPQSLLSPALTACSFEGYERGWSHPSDSHLLEGSIDDHAGEFGGLEAAAEVEQLPEWLDDDNLADALERLEGDDVEARKSAAHALAQFPTRRSVEALATIAARDESPAVRAAAVTSLGAIDHDSVFAPVLGALADDSREVRAAAARAFSGLNFDRADAAVRVIETADAETLRALASACVKSGLAAQAVSRLASEDRRQAYEAFSLLSLILGGGETSPIVEAVASHRDLGVRLAAVRVAVLSGRRELLEALRDVAARESLPDAVREAIAGACEQPEAGARL